MRGTNGDYLAGFDGSPADHRDCNTGVDNDLVCRRRSVCIFCGDLVQKRRVIENSCTGAG